MARELNNRDIAPILAAAERWIATCLVKNGSLFSNEPLWNPATIAEASEAFVNHPDVGQDNFITKLKGQMSNVSAGAKRLAAEMLWILLLFPSNLKPRTKRQQIREIWELSGQNLAEDHPLLSDAVLLGIGSGGPGFNTYRPDEMAFLMTLAGDIKKIEAPQRQSILTNYDRFIEWISKTPQQGNRQFRHMLRYFAFPDHVERISSNNDRRKILEAFSVASARETKNWSDRQLDDALAALRATQQQRYPSEVLDFYRPPLNETWSQERKIKTPSGEITVTVPQDSDEEHDDEVVAMPSDGSAPGRESIQIQAKIAEIGAIMGFKIWLPRNDRARVGECLPDRITAAFLHDLPLNYNTATLETIEQIDVIWLREMSIIRAFEVEHTTAVYSGLLRMADLLALQPNMDIRLHIVAPDERREKVFREMKRPVFSLLSRGPLRKSCSFLSYDNVRAISAMEYLAHTNESIIAEYEERAED
jgi:hypothetical protein